MGEKNKRYIAIDLNSISYESFVHLTWIAAKACVAECASGNKDSIPDGISDSTSSRVQNVNVIVTSGSLIPSLVKCLLFRLDDLFSYDNG